ncbi:DUF3021 domain-containing protein [Fructilactobacillus frigidiflavus]|uniref:DUF3021 domain-containing protein n=1 Tax=Fructilactobacillus frigidiflavus TaxID=3242688 RepID=UPI0037580AB5
MKKLINKIIGGIVAGIFYGFIIALGCSFYYHLAYFQPSGNQFVKQFGNNLNATAVSAVIWSLIGLVFSLSTMIFSIENWGITKQTIVHFIVTYTLFTPLAILAGWFPLQFKFMISFTIIFIFIYSWMWFFSFYKAKQNLKLLNDEIKAHKKQI